LLRLQRAPKSREVEERATPVGVSPP